MAGIKFANNVATTITSAINDSVTTIPVASIAGFPTQTGGDYFYATLAPSVEYADSVREIVKVTAWTTTSLTVVRAQDGTTGTSWAAGSKFELRFPRIAAAGFCNVNDNNTFTGTNTFSGTTSFTGNVNLGDTGADTITVSGGAYLGSVEVANSLITRGTTQLGDASGDQVYITGTVNYPITFGNSGGQIVFPSTQNASTDVNTLDDYEEGTFTPTIVGSSGGGATYSVQIGNYTKIGNRVFFTIYIDLLTTSVSGTVTIQGLPFAASGDNWGQMFGHGFTTYTPIKFKIASGTTVVNMYNISDIEPVGTQVSSTTTVGINGHYIV